MTQIEFEEKLRKLNDVTDREEYGKELVEIWLGGQLSLKTILLMAMDFGAEQGSSRTKWISVEEQLPPSDGNWWVCYSANEGGGEMEILLYDDGGWWDYDGRFVTPDVVTHWMPLPERPKGGEE